MKEILEKIEELKKQVQELSFQQDLNQEQLLSLINLGAAKDNFDWKNGPIICELNGYRWHLGTEADKAMNWAEAKAWCESVGGELPPRDVLLQAYLNEDIKTIFQKNWYWSGAEFNTQGAWRQFSGSGFQDYSFKTNTCYVRAVKKVKI